MSQERTQWTLREADLGEDVDDFDIAFWQKAGPRHALLPHGNWSDTHSGAIMESVNSDFKDLFSVLETHKVSYLLVDGYAVVHYTEPR